MAIQVRSDLIPSEIKESAAQKLHRAVLNLHATLDIRRVADAVLQEAMLLQPGIRRARLYLLDQGELQSYLTRWWDGRIEESDPAMRADVVSFEAARSGKMLMREPKRSEGLFLSLPLQTGSESFAVLALSLSSREPPSPLQLELLQMFARQAALALTNARAFETVSWQAYTDGLTGLPNRRAFDERLEIETRRSQRYQHPFTVVLFDMDGFKSINDQFGHPMGDLFLKQVSGCVRQYLRDTDFLARFGGDEFALILPETTKATANTTLSRLPLAMQKCTLDLPFEVNARISFSIGSAEYPQDAITPAGILAVADQVLYEAKAVLSHSGR